MNSAGASRFLPGLQALSAAREVRSPDPLPGDLGRGCACLGAETPCSSTASSRSRRRRAPRSAAAGGSEGR
jgi:hypothetical protein